MKSKPLIITLVSLLAIVGVVVLIAMRPKPKPNFEIAELDSVLDYTLLTDRFNDLPVQERVDLIGKLVGRFQSMDQSDSVLMAAFAAGISGAAREQIEKNFARLAIDLMDVRAAGYNDVPPEEREAYLNAAAVEFVRTMSLMTGEVDERSDAEILREAKQQAAEDKRRFQEGGMSTDQAGGIYSFMTGTLGGKANPHERARVSLYVRDMVRHLRDEPLGAGGRRR